MNEEFYKEVGTNYRFFLGWRHATFAGNLIVLGGALSLCISAYKDARELVWLIPLCASPVGVLFWIIDVRNRNLYHAAIQAGKTLEDGQRGFYTRLADDVILPPGRSPFRKLTQSAALNIAFLGSSLLLVVVSFVLARVTASTTTPAAQSTSAMTAPATPTPAPKSK
jgi:hypothetical protein